MLAERAPSSWLASQTSHCAAAVVASSSLNAAVQARSRIAAARNAASSSTTSRSPSRWALAAMAASRSAGEVATWGIEGVSCRAGPLMVPPRREAPAEDQDQRPGLTTIRKTMMTTRTPRNIPPRWIFLTVARSSGGGGPGGVPGGGGVEDISIR